MTPEQSVNPVFTRVMSRSEPDFPRWAERFFLGVKRAEVLMAVRNAEGHYWTHRKRTNPAGVWRLPTGTINPEEEVMPALRREVMEEFGADLPLLRPLGILRLLPSPPLPDAVFTAYLFLLDGGDHSPTPLDASEGLEAFKAVTLDELMRQALVLRALPVSQHPWGWMDPFWGQYRALEHELTAQLLGPETPSAFSVDST